jgi:hypothetical protein
VLQVFIQGAHRGVQRAAGIYTRSTWRSSTCCRYLYKEHMEEFKALHLFTQGTHGGVHQHSGIHCICKKHMKDFKTLQVFKQREPQEAHGGAQCASGIYTKRTTRSSWRSSMLVRYLYKENHKKLMEEFNALQVFTQRESQETDGGVQCSSGI